MAAKIEKPKDGADAARILPHGEIFPSYMFVPGTIHVHVPFLTIHPAQISDGFPSFVCKSFWIGKPRVNLGGGNEAKPYRSSLPISDKVEMPEWPTK